MPNNEVNGVNSRRGSTVQSGAVNGNFNVVQPRRLLPVLPAPPSLTRCPRPIDQKQSRISRACDACRTRKTKCNGNKPTCGQCISRQSACIYTETHHKGVKRKYHEMIHRVSTHEELFEMLKSMSEQDGLDVIRRIRNGTPLETILNQIRDGNLLMQLALVPERRLRYEFPYLRDMPSFLLQTPNVYTDTSIYDYSFKSHGQDDRQTRPLDQNAYESIYTTPYHSAEMADSKLELTRPSEWTSVCSNNRLMHKLLGKLFLSEYHMSPFFQKDYFLEDMAAGRNQFCSSLLVNAVLAWACSCDIDNPQRAEFWNPANLGYRFLAEARRLWELEAGTPKLTTIQAAMIFNPVYNMNGSDELGYKYNTMGIAMANELRLFDPCPMASQREQDARDFTAWWLYGFQGPNSYMMLKAPLCKRPPSTPYPDPVAHPQWYGEIKFKFPSAPTIYSTHFGLFLKSKIQLWSIAIEMATQFFGNGHDRAPPSIDQTLYFCTKLEKWYTALPEQLQARKIVTPYQLQLHMQYHNFIINLLEEPMTTQLSLPEHLPRSLQIFGQPPREILANAKRSLEILVRLYYLRHGFEANDAFMVQFLSLLAFSTNAAIQNNTDSSTLEALRSTIILVALGLRDQSHSHYLGQLVFNAVRNGMGSEEMELIDRFTEQGRGIGKRPPKTWKMQSIWAVDMGSIADTPEKRRLSNLVKPIDDKDPKLRDTSSALEL